MVLLEALPEPGCSEAHRPSNFLQALNHGQFISDCARANRVLPLEQLFSLLSVQPSCVHSEATRSFSGHALQCSASPALQASPPRPAPRVSDDPCSLPPHPQWDLLPPGSVQGKVLGSAGTLWGSTRNTRAGPAKDGRRSPLQPAQCPGCLVLRSTPSEHRPGPRGVSLTHGSSPVSAGTWCKQQLARAKGSARVSI